MSRSKLVTESTCSIPPRLLCVPCWGREEGDFLQQARLSLWGCKLFSNYGDERNSQVLRPVAAGVEISCFRADSTSTAFIHSTHPHWCLFLYSGKLAGSRKDRMRLGYLVFESLIVISEQQTSCLPNTHQPFWIPIFLSFPQSVGTRCLTLPLTSWCSLWPPPPTAWALHLCSHWLVGRWVCGLIRRDATWRVLLGLLRNKVFLPWRWSWTWDYVSLNLLAAILPSHEVRKWS